MTRTIRIAAGALAIAFGLSQIAGTAHAQDLNAMNDAFNAQLNGAMQGGLNDIIATNMNDPRIQMMYQQAVQSGQFYGSLADYAYAFAYTGGFSQEGYANAMADRAEQWAQMGAQNQGFLAAPQVYQDAYGNWVQGYANNQGQMAALWGKY